MLSLIKLINLIGRIATQFVKSCEFESHLNPSVIFKCIIYSCIGRLNLRKHVFNFSNEKNCTAINLGAYLLSSGIKLGYFEKKITQFLLDNDCVGLKQKNSLSK